MNLLLSVLSIIIIVAIIRFGVVILKANFFSWQKNSVLAGVYLAVLLILVPLLYLLPDHDFSKQFMNINQNVWQPDPEELSNCVAQGNLDQQNGVFKKNSLKFKLEGNNLGFNIAGDSAGEYQIFIRRKDVNDGEIEVSTYVLPPNSMFGVDYTRQILPPDMSLSNGLLIIKSGQRQELNFKRFEADFILNQFKQSNMPYNNGRESGGRLICVNVPKSLVIDDGNNHVTIVNNK